MSSTPIRPAARSTSTTGCRLLSACWLLLAAACGGGGGGGGTGADAVTDGSTDTGDAATDQGTGEDTGQGGDDGSGDGSGDTTTETPVVCLPCSSHADCGGEPNLCLELPAGGQFCGRDCAGPDDATCPTGSSCLTIDEAAGLYQCFPADLRCDDACAGVVCGEGEVCDPDADGECVAARGLCDPCTNNEQCGGSNDYCVSFDAAGLDRGCALDCTDAECPEGYFCATVGTATPPLRQCVPRRLTCVDRCNDVVCGEGERCDERTGDCFVPAGPCTPCQLDTECAGNACIGLLGPSCGTDADCPADFFCNEGLCVSGRCGLDCTPGEDGQLGPCPDGFSCYTLAGGEYQCLPFFLDCVDLCAGVSCPDGFNCEHATGECVRSRSEGCQPCEDYASCGGQDSLCTSLSVGGGNLCLPGCGDGRTCALGYTCITLSSTIDVCIPANGDLSCDLCETASCPEGTACSPNNGLCYGIPDVCDGTTSLCGPDEMCDAFEQKCIPVGYACTFANRFNDCGFDAGTCTAALDGDLGGCEPSCVTDLECPDALPYCDLYHGLPGRLCTDAPSGGAPTCGRLHRQLDDASVLIPIGRPCDPDDPDVATACGGDAPGLTCVRPDDAVGGLCTLACTTDADCTASGARCLAVDGGSYCVPTACECAATPTPGAGESDVLGAALARAGVTRCEAGWSSAQRRAALGFDEAHDTFRLGSLGPLIDEPLQAVGFARSRLAGIEAAPGVTAIPAIQAAARVLGGTYATLPVAEPAATAAPLADAIAGLRAAVGAGPDPGLAAAVAAVPIEVQVAAARFVLLAASAYGLQRSVLDFRAVPIEALVQNLHALVFASSSTSAIEFDAATINALRSERTMQAMHRIADAAARLAESMQRDLTADPALLFTYTTPIGDIVIAGTAAHTHTLAASPLLLIDLGGDDSYIGAVGANRGSDQPISIAIDLGGSDSYTYAKVGAPGDAGLLASDGAGRAVPVRGGNGPVTLSSASRQGAGRGGVGLLYDLGPGTDRYETLRFGQGYGLLGVGVLLDEQGGVEMTSESVSQGAGLFGTGIVVLGDNPNRLTAYHAAQGYGGPYGVGVLVGGAGDDVYTAVPGDASAGDALYVERLRGPAVAFSASQGAGVGSPPTAVRGAMSGGLGWLIERGGDDRYVAGLGAQGFGRRFGAGQLVDLAGDDIHDVAALGAGAGVEGGQGLRDDRAGRDTLGSATRRLEAGAGYGEDFGGGISLDRAGDDQAFVTSASGGYATVNGFGLAADAAGNDRYDADSNESFGRAVLTVVGSQPASNPRRGIATFALFVDARGVDVYARPDGVAGPVGDRRSWSQTSSDEAGLPVHAGGVDGLGPLFIGGRQEPLDATP